MLHTHKRITGGIAALALALGTAAPAAAIPVGLDGQGSNVPVSVNVQPPVPTAGHHNNGNGSDWGYIAAGAGAASLALIGIGGTVVGRGSDAGASHRSPHKRTATARSEITAMTAGQAQRERPHTGPTRVGRGAPLTEAQNNRRAQLAGQENRRSSHAHSPPPATHR